MHMIRKTGGYTSPEDMVRDMNTSGPAKTAKEIYKPNVYVPNMPELGYQVPYPPIEKARARRAKIELIAPDEEPANTTFGQKEKAVKGETKNISIRLPVEVIEAWRKKFVQPTAGMGALLIKFAQEEGWL